MKFSSQVSNLLGAIYRKGNLLFTPDNNSVISPVGNRICIYDLKNNSTCTLPVESKFNYETIAISPSGMALIAVNEDGEAHLISMVSRRKIYTYRFGGKVRCIRFSPNGKFFAACKSNKVFVFRAPDQYYGHFSQFVMEKVFSQFYEDTTYVEWSDDSRILAVGSKDGGTKLFSIEFLDKFGWCTLSGHTDIVVAAFFESNSLHINTLSRNGQLSIWESNMKFDDLVLVSSLSRKRKKPKKHAKKSAENSDSEDDVDLTRGEKTEEAVTELNVNAVHHPEDNEERIRYKRLSKHYLNDAHVGERNVTLTCATYHKITHILVTGYSNGSFFIHELPDVNLIHSLRISDNSITSVSINNSGDWIALGCSGAGQLLVWEWQSETYILKQQAHSSAISCVAYSPDGMYIVTGGEDGKVKVWNTQTGYCFIIFCDHSSAITGVKFANNRKFLVSSSLDGTVRAVDMARYRNFRTFTTPRPVQFSCVALDYSGEFVAAGGQDVFEIFLWSMKIGRLLECLSGHEGPVVSLDFSPLPHSTSLVSVSWDKTLKIWNAVESGGQHETIDLLIEGLCVAYRPDGKEIVVSTLNGNLKFFNTVTSEEGRSIEGRHNLSGGRSSTDMISAKQNLKAKAFTSVCYSADGNYVIAGGQSKYICIYSVAETLLVKKFHITQNRSLDAVDDYINHRKMTEFGNRDLIERREEQEGGNVKIRLPGVRKGDMAARSFKPEVRVYSIAYSPTGLAWVAATTEGILVYSLEHNNLFDPIFLTPNITPDEIMKKLSENDHVKALMMSIRLNEVMLLKKVLEKVPPSAIRFTVEALSEFYREKLLNYLACTAEQTKHIEYYLLWIQCLLDHLTPSTNGIQMALVTLQRNLTKKYTELSKICDYNKYTMRVLSELHSKKTLENLTADDEYATLSKALDTEDALQNQKEQQEENEMSFGNNDNESDDDGTEEDASSVDSESESINRKRKKKGYLIEVNTGDSGDYDTQMEID